jgi:BASS family bile acid:Na+ symporter
MNPAMIVKLAALLSIVLVVVSVGLRSRPIDALALVREPILGLKAILAMFVAVPAVVIAATYILPFKPPVEAALIALSVSPMPPMLLRKGVKAGGQADYVIGLQVAMSVASVIFAPIIVAIAGAIFKVDTDINMLAMWKTLIMTVGAPLFVGILIRRLWPNLAERLATPTGRIGLIMLMVAGVVILISSWPAVVLALGDGVLVLIAAIVLFGLLVGHLLGGPDEGNRGALAVACAARHPGVAITIATSTFPAQQPMITGAVLVYLLASIVLAIPYMRWHGRHMTDLAKV